MNKVSGQSFLIFVLSVLVEATEQQHNSNHTMNWSDAVQFCSERGMVLRKSKLGLAEKQIGKYWTRLYRRKSDLLYLYGCLNAHVVNISERLTIGRCIKECLDKSPYLFEMQVNGCSCVSDPVPKLQQQCDLIQSPKVFGMIGTLAKKPRESCVQIVCRGKRAEFVRVNCDQTANVMCWREVIAGNFTWEGATKECNNKKESLNVELNRTCSNNNNDGEKYWFGFGTVEYTDEYIKFNSVPDVNSTKCQGCEEDCKFQDCNENKRAACENVVNPNNNVTTPKYQSFQSTNEARHQTTERRQHRITKVTLHRTTEVMSLQTSEDTSDRTTKRDLSGLSAEDADDMVTIYCVSILLPPVFILFFLCFIYLRCRHQKRQTLKNKSDIPNNAPTKNMALTTALYELADNSKLEISVPNQTVIKTTDANAVKEDGGTEGSISGETKLTGTYTREDVYNHLWEKPADPSPEQDVYNHLWEKPADPSPGQENIYNQCNSSREEMSNYGVTGGPHSDSTTVTSNYDHVTLVNANVETSI